MAGADEPGRDESLGFNAVTNRPLVRIIVTAYKGCRESRVNHRTRSLACDGLRALEQSPQVGRITRLSPLLPDTSPRRPTSLAANRCVATLSMIRKSVQRFSEKHALGLDPRDHAQTIS
jgi:hypothetical protein